jgi:hypothetical protein
VIWVGAGLSEIRKGSCYCVGPKSSRLEATRALMVPGTKIWEV